MAHEQFKLIITILFFFGLNHLHAQEAVPTAGGNVLGSGGSVSYTVGQIFYQTQSDTDGSVAEGVQQPYEISVITAIQETKNIILSVSAYPNPTKDNLTLNISELDLSGLSYQLFNFQGSILQNEIITSPKTIIKMSNYLPASYFIKVIKNNEEVKTFKIIKNQ